MMKFIAAALTLLPAVALAGDIQVQARNLSDDTTIPAIQSIRVTVLNSAGIPIINQQEFAGDSGTVRFNDNALTAGNKTMTLVVSSDGRIDAVINVLFGEASQAVTVVLPIRPVSYTHPQPCCAHHRRGIFRRR